MALPQHAPVLSTAALKMLLAVTLQGMMQPAGCHALSVARGFDAAALVNAGCPALLGTSSTRKKAQMSLATSDCHLFDITDPAALLTALSCRLL
jgi:hypothetical protein